MGNLCKIFKKFSLVNSFCEGKSFLSKHFTSSTHAFSNHLEFCTTELLHEHLSNMWGWRIQNKYFSSIIRYFRQKQRLDFKNKVKLWCHKNLEHTHWKWKSKSYSSDFSPLFHLCVCLIMLNYADTSSRWADPLFTLEFAYCNKNQTALREIQSVQTMNGSEWWGNFQKIGQNYAIFFLIFSGVHKQFPNC